MPEPSRPLEARLREAAGTIARVARRRGMGAVGHVRRGSVRVLSRADHVPVLRPVADALMERLFDQAAPSWERIRSDPHYRDAFRDALERLPDDLEVGTALDVACGTGLATALLVERWPDASVTGCDISAGMLERARELVPEATFVRGRCDALPMPDGSCDLVAAHDGVLDLPELARVVAPGGCVLVSYSRQGRTPVSRDVHGLAGRLHELGLDAVAFTDGPGHGVLARRPAA